MSEAICREGPFRLVGRSIAMEIRHLETFVVVAESGSFTRAATIVGISRAAVSQHIAQIETELGVELFVRSGRGVFPTQTGRKLHAYATDILRLFDRAIDELSERHQVPSPGVVTGHLRVGVCQVPAHGFLTECLGAFHSAYPGVELDVDIDDSRRVIDKLLLREVEVGLVGKLPREKGLYWRTVAADEFVLVVPSRHPLAAKTRVTPADLKGQGFLVRREGAASRSCVELALAEVGLSQDAWHIALEIGTDDAVLASVEEGMGIAFLPLNLVRNRQQHPARFEIVDVEGIRIVRHFYLVARRDCLPREALRCFVDFVENWLRENQEDFA